MNFIRKYGFEISVILVSLFVNVLVFTPHIIGLLSQDSYYRFTNIVASFYQDEYSYFAWIKQAIDGHFLFRVLFTSESHSALVFHPIFLFIGLLVRIVKIPLPIVWYLACILSNIFLLANIYSLLKRVLNTTLSRVTAFILAVTGGGFGWLTVYDTADKLFTETTIFQTLRWPIIFSLSLGLLILSYRLLIKYYDNLDWKYSFFAGLTGLTLVLIHPYDVVTFYAIPLVFILTLVVKKRLKINRKVFYHSLLWLVPPLLPSLYYLFLSHSGLVYNSNSYILLLSPPPIQYILGFGFIFILGIAGIFFSKEPIGNDKLFLIVWIVIGFLLLYSPVSFQRRFIMGLILPLSILSAAFINFCFQKLKSILGSNFNIVIQCIILLPFLLLNSTTNIFVIKQDVANSLSKNFPYFIDSPTYNALTWLAFNRSQNSIVLSNYDTGTIIPRYTGSTVYSGHWAQTIDVDRKFEMVTQFFTGSMSTDEEKEFFNDSGINYVYYGKSEQSLDQLGYIPKQLGILELVYNSEGVMIYKVKIK